MPAENSIENQLAREYRGASSSGPSTMSPKRLRPIHSEKTTKPATMST